MTTPDADLAAAVRAALLEDLGGALDPARDITTIASVPAATRGSGRIVARESLIVAGTAAAREAFRQVDRSLEWSGVGDGTALTAGATLATVTGSARAILTGERVALNFLQRLSGVATLTRRCVDEIEGTKAKILDTRKTTPGLRALEKAAVAAGGGGNHRIGLHDAVLIKDNHVALAGGIAEALRRAAAAGHPPASVIIEVADGAGALEAVAAGAGRILLDNFTAEQVADAVRSVAGRAVVECSGGLAPGRLRPFALAGPDFLSIGSLTHSARAVDIALDLVALA